MKRNAIAQAAYTLAAQNFNIVPTHGVDASGQCLCPARAGCKTAGKHPNGIAAPHGQHDATTDEAAIRRWFAQWPDAGIAMAPSKSGLVVLDVDVRNGGDQTLHSLRTSHPEFSAALDSTVQVRSQGGGWHFYFQAAPDVRYPGSLGPGVDVKHHGLVMLPPSRGPKGQYMWVEGHSIFERDPVSAAAIASVLRPTPVALARPQHDVEHPSAKAVFDLQGALWLLDADDRETWIKVGYALWTAGEAGKKLWFDWSQRSNKFDERDARATWDSFSNSESHWRSVFRYAHEAADAWVSRLQKKGI